MVMREAASFRAFRTSSDFRVATLHAEEAHDRRQAVLDAVAHFARQHSLVVERFLEVGVGMLPLDGDAEQSREAGQEIGIRAIELSGIRAVGLEHAEGQMAFAAPCDQDVDRPFDPMIRQQLWRAELRFFLQVIGNHHLARMEGVAGRRFHIDPERHLADRAWAPANAGAHQQPLLLGHVLQHLGKSCFEALGAEFGRALQDLSDVAGLHGGAAELAQQRLLPQPVRQLLPGDLGGSAGSRYQLLPRGDGHLAKSCQMRSRRRELGN